VSGTGSRLHVGIVGGGLMGLALARRLAAAGARTTVLERDEQLGGLTTHHDYGSFIWDRFYHVILPTDIALLAFLAEIGLGDKLRWATTRTGFFVDRRFHSLDSALDFLRFPPLSLWSKARLAAAILYCSRIDDWRRLERVPVDAWLTRVSGKATYEKIWKPLLLAKLGKNYRRVSAVFIWSYIKRMFSARSTAAKKEQLGYVEGGYKTVFDTLASAIADSGGEVRTRVDVRSIRPESRGVVVETTDGERCFDKVIFTGPVNVLRRVASADLVEVRGGQDVEYLGVICMVLVTRRPLMPYYVLNIADDSIPFTGVIGMSNVVATSETAGRHITYVPRYVLSTDPELEKPDEEIREEFLDGIRRLFPDFDLRDIESVHINRAVKVQPLQVIGYSDIVPRTRTLDPRFFVLNTAQFVNKTLNNNSVIEAVDAFLAEFGGELVDAGRAGAPSIGRAAIAAR